MATEMKADTNDIRHWSSSCASTADDSNRSLTGHDNQTKGCADGFPGRSGAAFARFTGFLDGQRTTLNNQVSGIGDRLGNSANMIDNADTKGAAALTPNRTSDPDQPLNLS